MADTATLGPAADHDDPDDLVQIVTPQAALTLANSADASTVHASHDPDVVSVLTGSLRSGHWTVHYNRPVRVDEQGRVTAGLNELLAIVAADRTAPVPIVYGYDTAPTPLTWRPPTPAGEPA